ncbi:hypothetical protein [Sinorhizobium sp. GL28]|uniref:hypothetical protein n=1 Tax=Sinorhizobium sp. GL28 TaxID=1358418 RepID=UPI00071D22E2|nr:hypothetical protein [Sinorhizobium sp. GL28]KSV95058.1 hypothetical protein N184_15485 [Sinorhizobium sp. GL28]
MKFWLSLAVGAFLYLPSVHASAKDPATSFVRLHAIDLLEGALNADQTAKLQLIAHQAAIAAVCDGFTLDDKKVSKAFEALAPVGADKMTAEQKDYHDKHILVIYGMLVGGELTAMSEGACKLAEQSKADPDFAKEMVWQ